MTPIPLPQPPRPPGSSNVKGKDLIEMLEDISQSRKSAIKLFLFWLDLAWLDLVKSWEIWPGFNIKRKAKREVNMENEHYIK